MSRDTPKTLYNQERAKGYRESDELSLDTETRQCWGDVLKSLTTSFDHEITALDIGSGTGRWFYKLENVGRLVAIDPSEFMLEESRHPVNAHLITIKEIERICGDLFDVDLECSSFDFIYSIGVLGEHTAFDVRTCERIHDLLKVGGKAYFTVVDRSSTPVPRPTLKRFLAKAALPFLPPMIKRRWKKRLARHFLSREEMDRVFESSPFDRVDIRRRVLSSRRWEGVHFECVVEKTH